MSTMNFYNNIALLVVSLVCVSIHAERESGLIVTEVFPKATKSVPEWFEIYNNSQKIQKLDEWCYGGIKERDPVSKSPFTLEPNKFCAVVKDSTDFSEYYRADVKICQPEYWHTLYNTGDTIILSNAKGVISDCVVYSDDWFSEWGYQSIQRLDFKNQAVSSSDWVVSDLPTPGAPNRERLWRCKETVVEAGPLPFTPDGDGENDRLCIRISLEPGSEMDIRIIGFCGRVYKTYERVSESRIFWDGSIKGIGKAPVGPFFIVAEVRFGNGNVRSIRSKGVLWRR